MLKLKTIAKRFLKLRSAKYFKQICSTIDCLSSYNNLFLVELWRRWNLENNKDLRLVKRFDCEGRMRQTRNNFFMKCLARSLSLYPARLQRETSVNWHPRTWGTARETMEMLFSC